jgi:glc operon protein GlcG
MTGSEQARFDKAINSDLKIHHLKQESDMKKSVTPLMVVVLLVGGALAFAQQRGSGAEGQRAGGPPPNPPQNIDLTTAKKMVAAAEAAAVAANAHNGIAVVDANGDLVFFERMDGAAPRALTSAEGKARAAVLFGMPTKDVRDAANAGKAVSATITVPAAGAWELTVQQGGLPIIKNGKVIGGIGSGGSSAANDEKFAQAGLDSIK